MKINRFIALTIIALLVVGVMGAVSMKAFALGSTNTPVACANDEGDTTEVSSATETDQVEAQCGDQPDALEAGDAPGTEQTDDNNGPDGKDAVDAPNADNDNEVADGPDNETEVPTIQATATP